MTILMTSYLLLNSSSPLLAFWCCFFCSSLIVLLLLFGPCCVVSMVHFHWCPCFFAHFAWSAMIGHVTGKTHTATTAAGENGGKEDPDILSTVVGVVTAS